jgi:hypothetical protein
LENSGFSFEIIGAKRKIKHRRIKNANEKFRLLCRKLNFFLKRRINGIKNIKSNDDRIESRKVKLTTATAKLKFLMSKTIQSTIKER